MTEEQRIAHYHEHIHPLVLEVDELIRSKNPKFSIGACALITILCTQIEMACENPTELNNILVAFMFKMQELHFNNLIRESN